MFADVKGSLELLSASDPEEAMALLDPVIERMMAAVHRYEGTVNQIMGDGIMALFGAPVAHEDHAARACYAALAMQESIRRFAQERQRRRDRPVEIRVGLNSGEVVIRAIDNDLQMDLSAIGETTHLASRMEEMAPPGAIWLTRATLALADPMVQTRPIGALAVKGRPDPVEVFELVGARALRRIEVAELRGLTRFVGRELEMDELERIHKRAGTPPRDRGGRAGIGKSCSSVHPLGRGVGWLVLRRARVVRADDAVPPWSTCCGYFLLNDDDPVETVRARSRSRWRHLGDLDRALAPALCSTPCPSTIRSRRTPPAGAS
jgi:class 3 adenylate cyclase